MPPERYDLHTHTVASDGMLAAREVVALAVDRGLSGIAITDHDTVDGISQGVAAGQALGIDCIAGIELSCASATEPMIHILGYFVNPGSPELVHAIGRVQQSRVERAQRIVQRLNALGVVMTYEDVAREADGSPPGRPHIARAMVRAGVITEPNQAFSADWIAPGGRAWVDSHPLPLAEGIAAIHAAGGVAVFAHPGSRVTGSGYIREAAVREAAAAGLDGIEVDHPDHGDEALRESVALALELGLIQTAGSDDHGVGVDGPRLGCRTVPGRVVEQLKSKAQSYR